jgi:hypothetical protein
LRASAGLVAVVILAAPAMSEARENRVCVNAYKRGNQLAREAKFHAAKDAMLGCTKLLCSAALRKECMARVEQLTLDAPTLVPEVTDDRGRPVTDVKITMDGKPWVNRIDGRALPVDPGPHLFTFESRGVVFAKERMVVLQGQRNRALSAALVWDRPDREEEVVAAPPPPVVAPPSRRAVIAAPPPPPPPQIVYVQAPLAKAPAPAAQMVPMATPQPNLAMAAQAQAAQAQAMPAQAPQVAAAPPAAMAAPAPAAAPVAAAPAAPAAAMAGAPAGTVASSPAPKEFRVAPWLAGGLGLAGIGSAAVLTYWGRRDNELLRECSPNCSQASVNHIRQLYLAANISAGVGAAALATWAYLVFISGPDANEQAAARAPGIAFGLQPLPAGGFAAMSGSF